MAVPAANHELKADFKHFAKQIGVDSIGIADVDAYSAIVPNGQKPSYLADGMRSVVVITKHLLSGAVALEDVSTQSLNSHLALDDAGELIFLLAEWLEERGFIGLPVNPEYGDSDLVKSGGGLLDLKYTAEFAGLGHVGLNLNFLTPEYGSRVYLAALLTDAEMEPDAPLDKQLCPGLSCGRCAVTCPMEAIPAAAAPDADVDSYKNLDQKACSQGAMRISIRSLFRVLRQLVESERELNVGEVLEEDYWKDFWIATNSKRGAFAACFECMYVCPVGSRDVRRIFRVPYRKQDIKGKVQRTKGEDLVVIQYVGPPADRAPEYDRARDFHHLLED
jgi:ferredoxin